MGLNGDGINIFYHCITCKQKKEKKESFLLIETKKNVVKIGKKNITSATNSQQKQEEMSLEQSFIKVFNIYIKKCSVYENMIRH